MIGFGARCLCALVLLAVRPEAIDHHILVLQTLVAENVIKPLPSAPKDVWKAGLAVFNPIPCCDAVEKLRVKLDL